MYLSSEKETELRKLSGWEEEEDEKQAGGESDKEEEVEGTGEEESPLENFKECCCRDRKWDLFSG